MFIVKFAPDDRRVREDNGIPKLILKNVALMTLYDQRPHML